MIRRERYAAPARPKHIRADIGLPPGSAVYIGTENPQKVRLSIISFNDDSYTVKSAETPEELFALVKPDRINWINVNGLEGTATLQKIAERFGIHSLTLEDVLNTRNRPKVEIFEDYIFASLRMITVLPEGGLEYEQLSLVLMKDVLITFQEREGDYFDPIRNRLYNRYGRIRKNGADYLAYALLDIIVDNYFVVMESLGDRIEDYEVRSVEDTSRDFVGEIQRFKQELIRIRKLVWPVRESIAVLMRRESPLLTPVVEPYLKDLYDNVIQVHETLETYRDLAAGILEVNLNAVSNRMNEVMKVLTIISTIFIPLTFLVGVYGMNFRYMPELEQRWAYPLLWGFMILIAGAMLLFFKRKKWF
jgi:magnesium transporter